MALSSCRECHKRVSEEASRCPHCGVPRPASEDSLRSRLAPYASRLALVLLLFVTGSLWFRHQLGQLTEGGRPTGLGSVAYPVGTGVW